MVRIKLQIFISIVSILLLLANCEKNLTGFRYAPEYKIACIPKGIGDLYLFDTGRINQRLLVEGLVDQLEWSPTEPKLVYSIRPDDPSVHHSDLFVFNPQNNQKKLLADEEGYKNYPTFSPDGKSILYFNTNFTTHERKLTLMNADGSDKRLIFTQVFGEEVIYYYWSDIPDHLVFSRYDPSEQVGKLYLFNINTHLMQFVIAPEFSWSAFQTVDGNKFYYRFDDQANKISGINRVNINEQTVERIVTFSVPDWNGPFSVLPDGSKIVVSVSSIRQNAWVRDLYQVNTDGSNLEQLTESTGGDLYDDPAYLPDGSQIIFIHSTLSEREMWGLNPADGEIVHITEGNPFTGGSYFFKISSVKF
jgi:Tol biopolymer transport system component